MHRFLLIVALVLVDANNQRALQQATFYGTSAQYVYLDPNWAGRTPLPAQLLTVPADDTVQFAVNPLPPTVTTATDPNLYAHIYKASDNSVAVASTIYRIPSFLPQAEPYTQYTTLLGPDATTSIRTASKTAFAIFIPGSLLGPDPINSNLSTAQYYVGFDTSQGRFWSDVFYVQRFPLSAKRVGTQIQWNYRHGTPTIKDKIAQVSTTGKVVTIVQWFYLHCGCTTAPTTTVWSSTVTFASSALPNLTYNYYYSDATTPTQIIV